jgi:urease accessory protein UreF
VACKFFILFSALLLLALCGSQGHRFTTPESEKFSVVKTLTQTNQLPFESEEWLGDPFPLLARMGLPESWAGSAGPLVPAVAQRIESPAALRAALAHYQADFLRPVELPAIQRSYAHASRNEFRELIALDSQMADAGAFGELAAESKREGLAQLQRVRPMRDMRLARRYLDAVEQGQANGWHVLVYGVMLAAYSIPLRQGLLGYAARAMSGLIGPASRELALSKLESRELFLEFCAALPADVDRLLGAETLSAMK